MLGASCGVAALGVVTTALAHAVGRFGPVTDAGLGRWTAIVVAMASGLFLAAGVLRLAKWRLVRDAHSALVGTALVVMGGLCLPLGGLARLFVAEESTQVVGLAIRCVASYLAMALVLRALRIHRVARPKYLLLQVVATVALVFLLMLQGEHLVPESFTGNAVPPIILSAALAAAWFSIAVRVALSSRVLPWARRAAPLFLGMGIAELLRALDAGRVDSWTLSGVLVCASMAALATRSSLLDLDGAVRADQHQRSDLSIALSRAASEAGELVEWREQLAHDARNAVAGLRAAMEVMERYDGRIDAGTTERLRWAASQEIGHLEHLLFRTPTQPCEPFDVSRVVRDVARAARTMGEPVTAGGEHVHGLGRTEDLTAVLKGLLVNARTHAPGSQVHLRVLAAEGLITITCSDDGPGLRGTDPGRVFERGYRGPSSRGSGLGLYAARELMREQGGELELGPSRRGATFLLTLPAAEVARELPDRSGVARSAAPTSFPVFASSLPPRTPVLSERN